MDDVYVITINGTDYYCTIDSYNWLKLVDGYLINQGNSSITLYQNFPTYGDNTSGYPRIVCPVNTKAYVRNSYSTSNYQTLSVNSMSYKKQYMNSTYLMSIMIFFALVIMILKKR